jgi:hypothetical protein
MSQKIPKKSRRRSSLMPVLFILGGLVLLGAVFLAVRAGFGGGEKAQIEVKGSPRIKVDQEKIDLGNIKLGNTV